MESTSCDELKEEKDAEPLRYKIELKSARGRCSISFKAKKLLPISSLLSEILKLGPALPNGRYVHEVPFSNKALFIFEDLWKFAVYNQEWTLKPRRCAFSDLAEALELCCYLLMKPFFITALEWVLNSRIGIPQELLPMRLCLRNLRFIVPASVVGGALFAPKNTPNHVVVLLC